MAQKPSKPNELDRQAYTGADQAFRAATRHLPETLVADLAREVVHRLALRMPGLRAMSDMPTEAEIERFCTALLSPDEQAADRIILNVRRDGAPIETVYLGYIAGASRRMGEMWEKDQLSFIDVSLATGRLYRIIRGLRFAIAPVLLDGRPQTPALFVLTPGETHTLGIEMAADLFRRDGGDADVCIGTSHDDVLALAETRHYGVIVLVANSDRVIPQLLQLSVALRIVQPLTPIALAGNLIDAAPSVQEMVDAELVVTDIRAAIQDLRRLTNPA